MEQKDWLNIISEKKQIASILRTNDEIGTFGLCLSEKDVKLLLEERKRRLNETQRVEFGEGILPKLIYTFCDSPFIYQDNLIDVIGRLQDIFYEYKNESIDMLSDDELIEFMKKEFDGQCNGSLEQLEETILEEFARNIRVHGQNFLEHYYRERDIEDE